MSKVRNVNNETMIRKKLENSFPTLSWFIMEGLPIITNLI